MAQADKAAPDLEREAHVVTLVSVIFGSEQEDGSGFAVWRVRDGSSRDFRVTADLAPEAWGAPGDPVVVTGTWAEHPQHGTQFAADSVRPHVEEGAAGLVRWLSRQPGIGPATANRVISGLGKKALERLEHNPELVTGIPGLSADRA